MSIPGAASPLFLATTAGAADAFEISRSLRFNSADTPYLNRTPSSASNRKTWTWSAWVKKARVGEEGNLFTVGASSTEAKFRFNSNDTFEVSDGGGGQLTTAAVFRDTSAWYHIVVLLDNTQATAANRFKLYINGSEAVVTGSPSSQNTDGDFNKAVAHYIGRQVHNTANLFNGYLAEINFIDGSALDPTSFGAFDDNGVWQAKDTAGLTFGTNGFRLKFADNSGTTATTLGKDTSGNSNNFTPNNLSVTAGSGNDSLVDTPSNGDQTDTGAGGEVVGNYAVLSAVDNAGVTLSNGNLEVATSGWQSFKATIGVSSGKYYWESQNKQDAAAILGVATEQASVLPSGSIFGSNGHGGGDSNPAWTWAGANYYFNATTAGTGLSNHLSTDIVMYALDLDNGKLWFGRNGTWYSSSWATNGNPATGANPTVSGLNTSYTYLPAGTAYNGGAIYNFGQRAFAYTAPSGYKALCTSNLPTPTIADGSLYFDTKLFTANASTQSISLGFAPDFVWLKSRANAYGNEFYDIIRGVNKRLTSNTNAVEQSAANQLTSFDSNGFTLGDASSSNYNSGTASVGWAWDGGTSTVTNNDGSVASQVRASAASGFSIVSYDYPASGSFTVGHGLNAAPAVIIYKNENRATSWFVYHSAATSKDQYLTLNGTNAVTAGTNFWGANAPTSAVFGSTVGVTGISTDISIAYCFTPVAGYSSMGSYQGNGNADGPFVYTGFKIAWLLVRPSSTTGNWAIIDTARDPYNTAGRLLLPNDASAEIDFTSSYPNDILSNGFKLRNAGGQVNASGTTYVYLAFASNPFASNGGLAR